jgi:SOS-response transcriptional repressor LexA
MKHGLTRKQKAVFDFIRLYIKANGVSPSVRDIATGKIDGHQVMSERSSLQSVHRMIKCLEQRGWIQLLPGQARSITICD